MLTLWLYKYNGYIMNYLLPCYLLYFCHSVQQLCVSCVKKTRAPRSLIGAIATDAHTHKHTDERMNGQTEGISRGRFIEDQPTDGH